MPAIVLTTLYGFTCTKLTYRCIYKIPQGLDSLLW